jgi:hypothetical protein
VLLRQAGSSPARTRKKEQVTGFILRRTLNTPIREVKRSGPRVPHSE